MRPTTEEFLYFLLWTADTLARPTWRNLNDGFETWAWRNGLGRRIAELERLKLLEKLPGHIASGVVRLTEAGRRHALGGRDPVAQWSRSWDGAWRMVLFDIPVRESAARYRLWRYLRRGLYGYLQNSVWITPDPFDREAFVRSHTGVSVESLILIQGEPCGGESNAAIVAGAWEFTKINERYERYLDVLRNAPADKSAFRHWAAKERRAWKHATGMDPFLPAPLLPPGYLGRKAWKKRNDTLAELAKLAAFRHL